MSQYQSITANQIIDHTLDLKAPAVAQIAFAFAVVVTKWHLRHKTRQHLVDLPDELLKDIGLTRDEAYTEARRPFWRA